MPQSGFDVLDKLNVFVLEAKRLAFIVIDRRQFAMNSHVAIVLI